MEQHGLVFDRPVRVRAGHITLVLQRVPRAWFGARRAVTLAVAGRPT
ncbi:MAG: hypothetical protein ABW252_05655 [Polyangiales bacterium]